MAWPSQQGTAPQQGGDPIQQVVDQPQPLPLPVLSPERLAGPQLAGPVRAQGHPHIVAVPLEPALKGGLRHLHVELETVWVMGGQDGDVGPSMGASAATGQDP